MMGLAVFTWTDAAVREALDLPLTGPADGGDGAIYREVSTDTRTLGTDDLFVALVGENFDGHDFLDAAAEAGATGAVVSRDVTPPAGMTLYPVEDTLVALGRLARFRRRALDAPVVGLTGSSGKTTTKEFLRAALGAGFRVHATRGNLNNRIGVPLTLLATPADAQVVVVEMGTSEPGEIAALAGIVEPELALLITVGESHLEKLGSLEGVVREKLDVFSTLPPEGRALVGDTPAFLVDRVRESGRPVAVAGLSEVADDRYRPGHLEVDAGGRYRFRWHGHPVSLQVPGRHMAYNAVLALAVADLVGVDPGAAAEAVSAVTPGGMRGEVREFGPLTVLVDCYNANPQSTRAALDTLAARTGEGPRTAFLGTMLELGEREAELHDRVLEYALSLGLDRVVATGRFARALPEVDTAVLVREEDPEAAYEVLRPGLAAGGTLLLKASRGVRLEGLLPRLELDLAQAEAGAASSGPEEGA